MQRIEPVIRDYAWGSREALAKLAGRRNPTDNPEAELWVGAHEAGPAFVPGEGTTLDRHIAADPQKALGSAASVFGGRLPFLLKILAAEKALSIQAHPDAARAASAPPGKYGDSWPKPEAWVPLAECEAFIGSLPFEVAAERLSGLQVPDLTALVAAARTADDPAHALLSGILHWPSDQQGALVAEVVTALERRLADPGSTDAGKAGKPEDSNGMCAAWRCVLRVHEQFPGDIGVVVLLTMVYHRLVPGNSCFLPAGVLHTFVGGTAVEILANSDNVVRAGLTEKPVDIEELLTIVDLSATVLPEAPEIVGTRRSYRSGAAHFAVHEIQLGAVRADIPDDDMARVVLAIGPATVVCGSDELHLKSLEAAWISAADPHATVSGHEGSRVFVATPGKVGS